MQFIIEPTECPCCSYPLQKVNDQLFCKNIACSAQVQKKIEGFCKALGIKGMGPKSIEKLALEDISELYYLEFEEISSVLGEKLGEKLLEQIEASKQAPLSKVLEAFSIPLIGSTAAKKVTSVVSSLDDITKEICKEVGLGDKATDNLCTWLETDYQEIKEFLPFISRRVDVVTSKQSANELPQKTVCITGKLKSYKKKADAEDLLAAAGYKLVESITKTTDFLVDENNSSSSKRKKAEEYGISIITDLNDLIHLKEKT